MPLKFLYFDLGNVLLKFSHPRMCRQMAAVLGVDEREMWDFLFGEGQEELRFEAGEFTIPEFHERICRRFDKLDRRDRVAQMCDAAADIFELNLSIVPVVAQLAAAGHRLGMLSNIPPWHFEWIVKRKFALIPSVFEVLALSYRLGAVKPDPKIFQRAAELARVEPHEILYFDDIKGHVDSARAVGYDAVVYTTTAALVRELRQRKIDLNF